MKFLFIFFVLFCILLLVPGYYTAEIPAATPHLTIPTSNSPTNKTLNRICSARDFFSKKIETAAMKLDSFFWNNTDDANDSSSPDCILKLRIQPQISRYDGPSISGGLSLKIVLPHLQEKFRMFLDNIRRDELPGQDFPTTKAADNYLHFGINLQLIKKAIFALDADAGLRFSPLPEPFGLIRYSYEKAICSLKHTITEELFWYRDDGFGEMTQLDIERDLSQNYCIKNTIAALWAQHSDGVEFEETLALRRALGENRVGSIFGSLFWNKESSWLMQTYRIGFRFRALLYQDWLFYEIQPRLDWDSENDFLIDPSVRVMFDVLFGCTNKKQVRL